MISQVNAPLLEVTFRQVQGKRLKGPTVFVNKKGTPPDHAILVQQHIVKAHLIE